VLVRYSDYKTGVKIKIPNLKSLFRETYINCDYFSDCLTENSLVGKVVGLCADNTNSNLVVLKGKAKTMFSPNCRKTSGMA
jgi:hypothetical protein